VTKSSSRELTQLLLDSSDGNKEALDRLMPLVYDELRRLARSYMRREQADNTLQPTALVNEAYMKLIDQRDVRWQNRAHFFGIAAQLMRRILVDRARSRNAAKRGGEDKPVALDFAQVSSPDKPDIDVIALDDALAKLAEIDPKQSKVVELKFFGGLTNEEISEVLKISPATVKREWKVTKAWLYREIRKEPQPLGSE